VHASGVFTYQQHGLVVEHRHHHHRTVPTADQALEAAAKGGGTTAAPAANPTPGLGAQTPEERAAQELAALPPHWSDPETAPGLLVVHASLRGDNDSIFPYTPDVQIDPLFPGLDPSVRIIVRGAAAEPVSC
jgi:hypothetical protein